MLYIPKLYAQTSSTLGVQRTNEEHTEPHLYYYLVLAVKDYACFCKLGFFLKHVCDIVS